jgi:glycosyltransferase involved in cell wall biosynthesis
MPPISVVIPTYNRVDELRRTLDAFEDQRPTGLDFEIVVVDDGSTDGTGELLASWRSRRFRLRFDRQSNQGPARARNRALELAAGELVLFGGDDIEPDPGLLGAHIDEHARRGDPRAAVLGLTRWPEGAELTSTMRHIDGPGAQQFSYHVFSPGEEYDFRHFYTSNVSLRRALLAEEPEGFSTAFRWAAFEDAELAYRLSLRGMRIFYHPEAVAWHHHSYDARSFCLRQQRCGEMADVLIRIHPQLATAPGWRGCGGISSSGSVEPSTSPCISTTRPPSSPTRCCIRSSATPSVAVSRPPDSERRPARA